VLQWGGLDPDAPLGEEGALFPRADVEAYFAEVGMDTKTETTTPSAPAATVPEPIAPPAAAPPAAAVVAQPAAAVAQPAAVAVANAAAVAQPAAVAAANAAAVVQIAIDEFARVKLVVGTVKVAERVPKSSKLVRMEVDLGEPALRQIVAGIGKQYTPEQLVGRQIVVVSNLKPATLMGVESQGMVLAATMPDGAPVLLATEREVPVGSGVK
jgi:methionyl-tRNA synthetase